jgi:cation-transporting ATPase 13A3/4/5
VNVTVRPGQPLQQVLDQRQEKCRQALKDEAAQFLTCDDTASESLLRTSLGFGWWFEGNVLLLTHAIFYLFLVLLLGAHGVNKVVQERKLEVEAHRIVYSKVDVTYEQRGYRRDLLGSVTKYMWVLGITWLCLALCILALSNYHWFAVLVFPHLQGSPSLSVAATCTALFLVVWHILLLIRIIAKLMPVQWDTVFLVKASLEKATVVSMSLVNTPPIFSSSDTFRMRFYEWLRSHLFAPSPHTDLLSVVKRASGHERYLVDRTSARYIFSLHYGYFNPIVTPGIPSTLAGVQQMVETGLSSNEVMKLLETVGENRVTVPSLTWSGCVGDIILEHLDAYLFTLLICTAFTHFHYPFYTLLLFLFSIVTTFAYAHTRCSQSRAVKCRLESHHTYSCHVKRNGEWVLVPKTQLVPGDVVKVNRDRRVPCDMVLVTGVVTVEEGHVTGSSRLKKKVPLEAGENGYKRDVDTRHTLYAGSSVLHTSTSHLKVHDDDGDEYEEDAESDDPIAIVLEIGSSTLQATYSLQPVRKLSPISRTSLHGNDVYRLFLLIFPLSLLLGSLCVYFTHATTTSWFHFVSLFSRLFSPILFFLPLITYSRNASRLSQHGHTIRTAEQLANAGRLEIMCYDKTGTLTQDHMEFVGVADIAVANHVEVAAFFKGWGSNDSREWNEPLMQVFAVAHELSLDSEQKHLHGDPTDVALFTASGWSCTDTEPYRTFTHPAGHTSLQVVKVFPFDPQLRRMTVVARDLETLQVWAFTKGAPSSVHEWCTPVSIPDYYSAHIEHYSQQGFYQLACSRMHLGSLSHSDVSSLSRSKCESKHTLCGIALFYNGIRQDVKKTTEKIAKAGVHQVIVSGDEALTCIFAAREVGLMAPKTEGACLLATVSEVEDRKVVFKDVETGTVYDMWEMHEVLEGEGLPSSSVSVTSSGLSSVTSSVDSSTASSVSEKSIQNKLSVELAITGAALDQLLTGDFFNLHYHRFKVFARVTPQQKERLMQFYRARHIVGMVGNGANDLPAICAANLGVSISSPFQHDHVGAVSAPVVSEMQLIQGVEQILAQGSAYLAVLQIATRWWVALGLLSAFGQAVCCYLLVYPDWIVWVWMDALAFGTLGWWMFILPYASGQLISLSPKARVSSYYKVFSTQAAWQLVTFVLGVSSALVAWVAWLHHSESLSCHLFQSQFLSWTPAPFLSYPLSTLTPFAVATSTAHIPELTQANGRVYWSLTENLESMGLSVILFSQLVLVTWFFHWTLHKRIGVDVFSFPTSKWPKTSKTRVDTPETEKVMKRRLSPPLSVCSITLVPTSASPHITQQTSSDAQSKNKRAFSIFSHLAFFLPHVILSTLLVFILLTLYLTVNPFLSPQSLWSDLSCGLFGWYCSITDLETLAPPTPALAKLFSTVPSPFSPVTSLDGVYKSLILGEEQKVLFGIVGGAILLQCFLWAVVTFACDLYTKFKLRRKYGVRDSAV